MTANPSWTWAAYQRREYRGARLTWGETEMLVLLVMRRIWSRVALIDALWGHREDGGPLWASKVLSMWKSRINRKIVPDVIVVPMQGYLALWVPAA